MDQHGLPRLSRLHEHVSQAPRQGGEIYPLGGILADSNLGFHDLWFVTKLPDCLEELFQVDPCRAVGDIEAIILEIDFDILHSEKPIQGFLDLVRSTHSSDALGLHEAGHTYGDVYLLGCGGCRGPWLRLLTAGSS